MHLVCRIKIISRWEIIATTLWLESWVVTGRGTARGSWQHTAKTREHCFQKDSRSLKLRLNSQNKKQSIPNTWQRCFENFHRHFCAFLITSHASVMPKRADSPRGSVWRRVCLFLSRASATGLRQQNSRYLAAFVGYCETLSKSKTKVS